MDIGTFGRREWCWVDDGGRCEVDVLLAEMILSRGGWIDFFDLPLVNLLEGSHASLLLLVGNAGGREGGTDTASEHFGVGE